MATTAVAAVDMEVDDAMVMPLAGSRLGERVAALLFSITVFGEIGRHGGARDSGGSYWSRLRRP